MSIAAIEIAALIMGVNGLVLATAIGAIAAIAGHEIGKRTK